jgi:futalosine hydrolase
MRILVVAATGQEIPGLEGGVRAGHDLDLVVTGVGMVATAARTALAIARTRYDVAFNFGVCGSFDRSLVPGTVVHVVEDRLSELGVEDGDRFVSVEDLGLADTAAVVNDRPPANDAIAELPRVRAITVNTGHGREASIADVVRRFAPQVESMEGAAFAYACALGGVPYAQVRSVSNIVERRNRDAWRMELAVRNLNEAALRILDRV